MPIQSVQLPTQEIDVNTVFSNYKYAIPEHAPIKLSNGMWLHTYRCTKYRDEEAAGDPDVEQYCVNNEMYGQ